MAFVIDDRMRRLLLPAFALLIAGIAVLYVQRYVSNKIARERQELEDAKRQLSELYPSPVPVVVAARDLNPGTAIQAEDLKVSEVPERYLQPYAARQPQELVGMVTLTTMAADEQILTNKVRRLEDVPTGETLSGLVPKGKRAVTIAVDTITGVGGFVRPGDIVDVLWTLAVAGADQKSGDWVTVTLFQDVPIMAVASSLEPPQRVPVPSDNPDAEGEEAQDDVATETREPGQSYTITLALTPQEISFLLFAREQGRIQLSLRPRGETGTQVEVPPVNMNTMLSALLGAAANGPAPKPNRQIEVFKGLDRDVVVLPDEETHASP